MVLVVPLDTSVNFTDQKFCGLKSRKSGKVPKFLMIISFQSTIVEDKLKLGTITPTQLVNKSVKKKKIRFFH